MGEAKDIQGISDLRPDPANANLGTERGLRMLDDSLREDGAGRSILVDRDGVTIAGAKTLERAADIGLPIRVVQTDGTELVVVQRTDLDLDGEGNEQVRARRMAYRDNRSSEVGLQWDVDQLLADVETGVDLTAIFRDDEIEELLAGVRDDPAEDPGAQMSKADELQEKWGTALGQVWELGEHRLVCGDCTDPSVVEAVMGEGGRYDLLVTDPPYGVSYADKNKFLNAIARGNRIQTPIEGDHKTPGEMSHFWRTAFSVIREYAKPGACYYVTGPQGGDLLLLLLLALQDSGFPLRHMLIWAKNNHVLGRSDYNYKHEPIIYGWVDGAGHKFYGVAGETSLWEIPKPQKSDLHPTTKPVELFERAIRNSTLRGDVVLDPFAGSGTTGIACQRLGRKARLIEIDPKYCAVILQRFADMGLSPAIIEDVS